MGLPLLVAACGLLVGCGASAPDAPVASQVAASEATAEAKSEEPNSKPVRGGRRAHSFVEDGLKWLAGQQAADGGWQEGLGPDDEVSDDAYLTSLVVTTYLGACYTNRGRHPFAKTVGGGLRWLKRREARADKLAGVDLAASTKAFTTAWAMTGSPLWRGPAQRGLDRLATASRDLALRDSETVGWALLALLEARHTNHWERKQERREPFVIDGDAFLGLAPWAEVPPDADQRRQAIAALARIALDPLDVAKARLDLLAPGLAERPLASLPENGTQDPLAALFSAWAVYFAPGKTCSTWQGGTKALAERQVGRDGPAALRGAWDPADFSGPGDARVHLTAICTTLLRMRHLPYSWPLRIEEFR